MPAPVQLGKINFSSLSLPEQLQMSRVIDAINTLGGYSGPVQLQDDLDLNGNQVKNVAPPTEDSDVLTSGVARASYSAAALRPQLEAGSSQPMVSYRQINNGSQREVSASWLNDLMSTSPNANAIYPTLTTSGGSVQSVIPASLFTFSDGSTIMLNGRTDLLSLPATYALSSISASGGVVTAVFAYTGTPPSIAAGNAGTIAGVSPSAFNGTYTLTLVTIGVSTITVEYQDTSAAGSGTGGDFELNSVWYYAAKKRSQDIYLLGPYGTDSNQNRINAAYDGYQLVCVVVITNSGGQVEQSGGGGSPLIGSPAAGSFF
jgi:hypothetical protein